MNRLVAQHSRSIALFIGIAAVAHATTAQAAPPWQTLVPFKKIDADPNNSYPLADTNGPWMIMATTFSGENAQQQAHDLVQELRRKHKLNAYTYSKAFDYTQRERGIGLDKYGKPKRMRYQQPQVMSEVAVLVGDYDTVDDAAAQKTLDRIKYLQSDAIVEAGEKNSQTLGAFRQLQKKWMPASSENRQKGAMGHAFIATNPLLPPEYFSGKGIDKMVLDMNKDVEHSLLNCKAKFSVKVATFNGAVLIDQRKIEEVESGKKLESRLAEAGEKAHRLADELCKKGYEAYEFHDRHSSIVCVGSFNSVGTPRADGKMEIDPTVHKIMQTFGPDPESLRKNGTLQPRTVTVPRVSGEAADPRIPLDLQPLPVEVPRRSISADYQQSMRLER